MKWRMTLFTLLVVLALAGMVSAHIWYYDGRDQVGGIGGPLGGSPVRL